MEQRRTPGGDNNDLHPLLKDRLHRPRSVFSPGHRIRMNVLPMFLNLFLPWAMFIFVSSVLAFWMMYTKPALAYTLVGFAVFLWLVTLLVAVNRRKHDPEPAWYSYFAFMTGAAVISGILIGMFLFKNFSLRYFLVKDMKVIGHLDTNVEHGQNVLDAGIVYFAEGNQLDPTKSWHFMHGSVYCVAPILKGGATPATGSIDFWAVGKDCCSVSASDFRCGAYNNPAARSGIRILGESERAFYRLAVEQAETLYGVMATHPVFFEWSQDPLETVIHWKEMAYINYLLAVAVAFVVSLIGVSTASCKFAWIGRSANVYGEQIFDDPDFQKGGYSGGRRV